MLLKSSGPSVNFILVNSLACALGSRGESCNGSESISEKTRIPFCRRHFESEMNRNIYVVRRVVKTEGGVESDDECVEIVFRFHAELQE